MKPGDITKFGVFQGEVMVARPKRLSAKQLATTLALPVYQAHLPLPASPAPGGKSPEFFADWAVAYTFVLNGKARTINIEDFRG